MKTAHGLAAARRALQQLRRLERSDRRGSAEEAVSSIIEYVRSSGDDALRQLTRELEGLDVAEIEVPEAVVKDARNSVPEEQVDALETAADRIRGFHEATLPRSWMDESKGYGEVFNPVGRVGVYVPGGNARFPSTVLMTVIPARTAGVPEVVIATPSADGATPHTVVLAAADIAGADRVFQIGGAQAIAAMAYGTDTVPSVDMICGPGGLYTTLAKRAVYGAVGIDGLYGPTETVVIADETANPTMCAADLVAQAEHDPLATPVLITTSHDIARAARNEAKMRAARLPRSAIASTSLDDRGLVAVVEDLDEAVDLANHFAPEHLCLMVADPTAYVDKVRNAGAIFLGELSHEVLGDYVAGPSHVMPTGGTARFGSGIGVRTFLKVSPVIGLDDETSASLSASASVLARAEGFTGHAEAAEIRDELARQR